jgi:MFS family permease
MIAGPTVRRVLAMPASTSRSRVFLACLAGTSLEWFDFFLYSSVILYLPETFLPEDEQASVWTFLIFIAGFVARPLGAIIFARLGDAKGGQRVLMVTLLLMILGIVLPFFIEPYERMGPVAPALLVLERFVQGLSLGGEWGAAVVLAFDHTGTRTRRATATSWVQLGVPVGLLLTFGTWTLAKRVSGSNKNFEEWGWQLPFLMSAALMVVGLWLSNDAKKQKMFDDRETSPARLWEVFRTHRPALAAAFCVRIGVDVAFYIFAIYPIAKSAQSPHDHGMLVGERAVFIGALAALAVIPLSAVLSDLLDRHKVYYIGVVATAIWVTFFFFPLVDSPSPPNVYLAIGVGMTLHAVMYGPQAAFIAERFHSKVRYSGTSLGYHLPGLLGGALALEIAKRLDDGRFAATGLPVYLLAMLAVTVYGLVNAPDPVAESPGPDDPAQSA